MEILYIADNTQVIENSSLKQIFPFVRENDILVNPSNVYLLYDLKKMKMEIF